MIQHWINSLNLVPSGAGRATVLFFHKEKFMNIYCLKIKQLVVGAVCSLFLLASSSAFATRTAVIALYPDSDEITSMMSDIEQQGLMNCKQVVEETYGIILVQLECNTLEDMKIALATDIFPVEVISSSMIWVKPPRE